MTVESPEELSRSCTETIEQYPSRPDLRDQPLEDPDALWFIDGSNYIHDGIQKSRYARVDFYKLTETDALPPQTLAQKNPKLIPLVLAPNLGKDKRINIRQILSLHVLCYMLMLPSENTGDSDCTGLSPPALPGVLLELLEAEQDPKKMAVIHCKRCQKGNLQYQQITWPARQ